MSNSLFKKKRPWVIRSWFEQISCKNEQFTRKICIFRMFLTVFPFLVPKSKSLMLLFAHSLFIRVQIERFASVALYKRAKVGFAQKKWIALLLSRSPCWILMFTMLVSLSFFLHCSWLNVSLLLSFHFIINSILYLFPSFDFLPSLFSFLLF